MTTQPLPPADPMMSSDLKDIQGDIIGFKNDHQRLLFLVFADTTTAKAFTAAVVGEINSGAEVLAANARYSERQAAGEDQLVEEDSWVNIAYSFEGLTALGATGIETFPEDFRRGMAGRAAMVGDVGPSAPATWVGPFAPGQAPVHAMVTIAADAPALLEERTAAIRTLLSAHGVSELGAQDGNVRPAPNGGHEHFGFKDGISQPGIQGLTESSKGGTAIAAGEFLIGYPDQDGHMSGMAGAPTAPPQPGEPGYGTPIPSAGTNLPAWASHGSFAVYRRLRQDVAGFTGFITANAPGLAMDPDQLGAKLMGRWKSGAPLEAQPDIVGVDPAAADPSTANPVALDDAHVNNFDYSTDVPGLRTPHGAHTRKAWPRDAATGGVQETNRHRMLRRGIPYGADFVTGEPAYGAALPDTQDRGLLFVCYQSSIANSFEFVQATWANTADFPQPATGQDPIISQDTAQPGLAIPPNPHLATANWVTTTGGGYFFAPSISALRTLSGA